MFKSLADIVAEANLVSHESLARAMGVAVAKSIPLVVALVRHFALDELTLVAAIRRQTRVPIADPVSVEQDPEALRELPRDTCRRLCVVPLNISAYDAASRVLRLAMADPSDAAALAEVGQATRCRIEPLLMTLSAVEELIDRGYRSLVTEVMPRPPQSIPPTAPERASRHALGQVSSPTPSTVQSAPDIPAKETPSLTDTLPDDSDPAGEDLANAFVQVATTPLRHLHDEASLEVRHKALLNLLINKGLITEEEYQEQIRQLFRGPHGTG